MEVTSLNNAKENAEVNVELESCLGGSVLWSEGITKDGVSEILTKNVFAMRDVGHNEDGSEREAERRRVRKVTA